MPFVIDSSVAVGWLLKETDSRGVTIMDRLPDEPAVAPAIWWYEIRNVLLLAERHHRISVSDLDGLRRELSGFLVEIDDAAEETAIFAFARKHRLTFYDAVYLEVAARRSLPLATLDRALIAAAQAERVRLTREQ